MDMTEFKSVIEALHPIVGELTDGAIWLAALYIGFNLLISLTVPLSCIYVAYKFGIMLKEWALTKKKTVKSTEVSVFLDKELITDDVVVSENILEAFNLCKNRPSMYKSIYMHKEHSKYLLDAVKEKIERES